MAEADISLMLHQSSLVSLILCPQIASFFSTLDGTWCNLPNTQYVHNRYMAGFQVHLG